MEIKMTKERMEEARARCDAATKGPWEAFNNGRIVVRQAPGSISTISDFSFCTANDNSDNDAAFCAHARQDLPDALDTIDKLEKKNASLRAELYALRGKGEAAVNGRM